MKRTEKLVRFDSPTQLERARRAARARKWSVNRFIVEAVEATAKDVLGLGKPVEPQLAEAQAATR